MIGAWTVIMVQTIIVAGWTGVNLSVGKNGVDPFPFISLNLFFSFQAADTAPAIMMSRKREADRYRAEIALNVNMQAGLEMYALHDKIDYLDGDSVNSLNVQLRQMSRRREDIRLNMR